MKYTYLYFSCRNHYIYTGNMLCQLYWFVVLESQINTREEGLHIDSISVGKILSKNNQTIKLAHNQQW